MRFYATTATTEDKEQNTVSAQKNDMFSSQRFFGLEKEFREETQLCALKNLNVFITALLWKYNKGWQRITTKENLTILG